VHFIILIFFNKFENMKLSIATVVLAIASANAAVPSLNPGNYESLTEGKTVFIKFFAPW